MPTLRVFRKGLGWVMGRNCTAPAESAYPLPMTCACQSVHGFPCQFPAEETVRFDGREWCRFHLPLQDAAGNQSAKGLDNNGWEEGGAERRALENEIFDRFNNTAQSRGADLRGVAFPPNFSFPEFNNNDSQINTNFSRANFKGPCHFTNREFKAEAKFNGAVFHDLVEFHGCEFHQDMSFHQTEFRKTIGANDDETEELERSYRTLKLGMEGLRARNEEADFFALEMECRRQRSDVPRTEWLAATLYKHLSDYGRSMVRPAHGLMAISFYAFMIYWVIELTVKAPEMVSFNELISFTLEQVFRPFYVWGDVAKGQETGLVTAYPLLIPLLASLQSLITIGLLTLFLLALRRRFKMD